jgi:chorismate--pyruvate lyase
MALTFSNNLTEQNWLNLAPMPHSLIGQPWRQWLLHKGSLTQRLKELNREGFCVQLIHTGIARASLSEARTLGIPTRSSVYVREVNLCIHEKVVVMARTVIPHSTLTGAERQLLALNNKPLGEFLFSHKNMSRNSIQIKRGRVDQNLIWGRRSIFKLNNKPLLVSEYFLPSLLEVTSQ